jgi:hypothetical protein
MNHRKTLQWLILLIFTTLFLVACKALAAFTPEQPTLAPTLISPTITPVPSEMTLFLCSSGDNKILTEICSMNGNTQEIFYPQYPEKKDFETKLSGDIQGTSYTFNLNFASSGTTTFEVSIILRQNGLETILAKTSINAKSTNFEKYSETVSGLDPATSNGDTLILRILPVSGADGAVIYADSTAETSHIIIPFVK